MRVYAYTRAGHTFSRTAIRGLAARSVLLYPSTTTVGWVQNGVLATPLPITVP